MSTRTVDLFLLEDLRDVAKTSGLAEGDLAALSAVSDWIETYAAKPHKELVGHEGPVCPFVPGSLERKTLWLASEHVADRSEQDVVSLLRDYKTLLLDKHPVDGDDAIYKVIVVVFPDLSPEQAKSLFGDVLGQIAGAAYSQDGVAFGPYFKGNEVTAIYNSDFRPFESPVPFIFVRPGVSSDWKFFLDDKESLENWIHFFGESAAHALATELRRMPWRATPD